MNDVLFDLVRRTLFRSQRGAFSNSGLFQAEGWIDYLVEKRAHENGTSQATEFQAWRMELLTQIQGSRPQSQLDSPSTQLQAFLYGESVEQVDFFCPAGGKARHSASIYQSGMVAGMCMTFLLYSRQAQAELDKLQRVFEERDQAVRGEEEEEPIEEEEEKGMMRDD